MKIIVVVFGYFKHYHPNYQSSFHFRSILKQHMQVHTGKLFKCDHPGCIHTARKMSELKTHYLTHTDVKNFACNICDYKGKTKTHLKR